MRCQASSCIPHLVNFTKTCIEVISWPAMNVNSWIHGPILTWLLLFLKQVSFNGVNVTSKLGGYKSHPCSFPLLPSTPSPSLLSPFFHPISSLRSCPPSHLLLPFYRRSRSVTLGRFLKFEIPVGEFWGTFYIKMLKVSFVTYNRFLALLVSHH